MSAAAPTGCMDRFCKWLCPSSAPQPQGRVVAVAATRADRRQEATKATFDNAIANAKPSPPPSPSSRGDRKHLGSPPPPHRSLAIALDTIRTTPHPGPTSQSVPIIII